MQRVGSFTKPFATGMFMLFERNAFWALGGFNERALFAGGTIFSRRECPGSDSGLCAGGCLQQNRRFQKLGHWTMVRMFVRTMMHSWDDGYFLRDHNYWTER